jgi:ubiquinone/menaquinone biosynthesis C-methylase UbiE
MPPLGVPQIVAAVAAAGSVLDAGCGSARLTLALVEAAAADVVGIDTSLERLAQGRAALGASDGRPRDADGGGLRHVLPFSDGRFSAAVSRLALMTASDPVVTLRELRSVTAAGGRIVTAPSRSTRNAKSGARPATPQHCTRSRPRGSWQHPNRLIRPYRPRDHTIWTLLHVWTDLRFHQQG